MKRGLLIDTGPLVALVSERDRYHEACVAQLRELTPPLLCCWPVLTEAAWLLRRDPQTLAKLFDSFDAGLFHLVPLDTSDIPGIAATLTRYRNLSIQLADAALLHLANRESIATVFTLDRRDFSIFRLKSGRRLQLIP